MSRGSFCSAYGCSNSAGKRKKNMKFHGFPMRNPDLLKKWVAAVRRLSWAPTVHSKLCSDHFMDHDYVGVPRDSRLLPMAVPSVFNFPPDSQPKKAKILNAGSKRPLSESSSGKYVKPTKCAKDSVPSDHNYCTDSGEEQSNSTNKATGHLMPTKTSDISRNKNINAVKRKSKSKTS